MDLNNDSFESLFQVKTAILNRIIEKFGGRKGVMSVLKASLDAHRIEKNYNKALDIIKPLKDSLEKQPFISNSSVVYVSIFNEMERALYYHFYQTDLVRRVVNIDSVCPIESIWRQYALSALELGDYSEAEKAANAAIHWNPVSAKYRLLLAMIHMDQKCWDLLLDDVIQAMKFVYKSDDLVVAFGYLRDYFFSQKKFAEAVCCSLLRSQLTYSDGILVEIAKDELWFTKIAKAKGKKFAFDSVDEFCSEYGFSSSFNPEVISVAKKKYKEAYLSGNAEVAEYFSSVLAEFKTVHEKRKSLNDKQIVEHFRKILS